MSFCSRCARLGRSSFVTITVKTHCCMPNNWFAVSVFVGTTVFVGTNVSFAWAVTRGHCCTLQGQKVMFRRRGALLDAGIADVTMIALIILALQGFNNHTTVTKDSVVQRIKCSKNEMIGLRIKEERKKLRRALVFISDN